MKAEELRIGNIVSYKGEPARVTMIGQYGIQALGTDNVINAKFGTPDIEPIPLTPEILEKAGFVKVPKREGIYRRGLIQLYHVGVGGTLCYIEYSPEEYCYLHVVIRYVHQLQNLIFTLTSSELPINL